MKSTLHGLPKTGSKIGTTPEAQQAPAPAKTKKAKAKTKTEKAFAKDAMEALNTPGLQMHAIKRKSIAEVGEVVGGTILSEFPVDDLSKIETHGRWAQGFRLDGGTLRLMWLNARRSEESDGTPGFELFFQVHG